MQNYTSALSLTRKSCFILLIAAGILCSCKQNDKPEDYQPKKSALTANNDGVKIFMKVFGREYPEDSLATAVNLYKKAFKEDPGYRLAFRNLLDCYNYMNRYNESVTLCSAWLKKNPNDVDAQYQRAMLYDMLGKSELAQPGYKAVSDEIENQKLPKIDITLTRLQIEEILNNAGVLYIATHDNTKALAVLSELKAIFPNDTLIESVYDRTLKNDRLNRVKELLHYKG